MFTKLLGSKRNKIIASVLCVAILLSSVAIGLAATFASSDLHVQFSDPNPGYVHVEAGKTQPVTATNGFTWMSGNTATAMVSYKTSNRPNATLTGVKAGTTVLSVGTRTGYVINLNVQVTDSNNITEYKISNNGEGYLNKSGDSMTIPITTTPAAVKDTLQWKSSNTNVATVDATGKITATTNVGATIISAQVTDKWGVPQFINFVVAVGTKGIILGPDDNGDYYKELGDPKNVYEIVDKDGESKTQPPTYVYDEDGNPLDGNSKPAEKTDDGKYYVEDPAGSNIWKEVESDGTLKDTPAIWGGNDKKPGGGDDKTAVKGDDGKWYVEDPDGSNLWKEVGTDGKLKDTPVIWGGEDKKPGNADDKTATKGDDGKWYVEDPTNIWWQVGSDGNLASTPIWGGADKKPGSADDKPAAKYGDDYYVGLGQNIFQKVTSDGLLDPTLVGGGADNNPATDPVTPIYDNTGKDGKYYVGPITSGGETFYYGDKASGGDGLVNSSATTQHGTDDKFYMGPDGNMTTTKPVVKTLAGIVVKDKPSKTIYTTGETFDPTDLTLTASYSDGTTKTIRSGYEYYPTSALTTSRNSITIFYEEDGVEVEVELPIQVYNPVTNGAGDVVDGRTYTEQGVGTFVEIAQNGAYSLIIRTECVQTSPFSSGSPLTQKYAGSTIQNVVQEWFYGGFSANANIRNYVVTSDVMSKAGTHANMSAANNYSVPTGTTAVRTIDTSDTANRNAAFILSFGEAAQFCSETWYSGSDTSYTETYTPSNVEAKANYSKLSNNENLTWLRSSSGIITGPSGTILGHTGSGTGRVWYGLVGNSHGVRPAMWVHQSIFND